jgi:cell fate (sporulation/competence/biofilm development) regulator YlbF (YheA/YmcA/DUF963 family)
MFENEINNITEKVKLKYKSGDDINNLVRNEMRLLSLSDEIDDIIFEEVIKNFK